jgi:peptidoglycan hydrolase-like protein with peptidoglycan-binding domain
MLMSKRLSTQPEFVKATRQAPVARGAHGPAVVTLQDLLVDLGFRLPISLALGRPDGIFGRETEAAVKQFQRQQALPPDGMVGPLTLGALDVLILRNPLVLEVVDMTVEKADMVTDLLLPVGRRKSAYW